MTNEASLISSRTISRILISLTSAALRTLARWVFPRKNRVLFTYTQKFNDPAAGASLDFGNRDKEQTEGLGVSGLHCSWSGDEGLDLKFQLPRKNEGSQTVRDQKNFFCHHAIPNDPHLGYCPHPTTQPCREKGERERERQIHIYIYTYIQIYIYTYIHIYIYTCHMYRKQEKAFATCKNTSIWVIVKIMVPFWVP